MVVFGQSCCIRAEIVVFGESGRIPAKMVQSGQYGCNREKWFY